MSSVMTMERAGAGLLGTSVPGFGPQLAAGTVPGAANWCVLPRCTIRVEKCAGGCKIHCCCDDEVACGALQNLCRMLSAGTCTLCCTLNGITVCQCSLTCGICKVECTKDGCCITCTSGDKTCCNIIQACCDCVKCCLEAGCCCYVCFGNTPVCCGCQC